MIESAGKQYWKYLNYHDALLYLSFLDIDGHNDWRMPTLDDNDKVFPHQHIEKLVNQHWIAEWPYSEDNLYKIRCIRPVRDL
jgi:hypothetical protein